MNVTDFQEVWQIDTGGQIYTAGFEEMAQWIYEGSLLRQDMVKRGNLRWIEAQKVPTLLPFFNAKEQGLPFPVFASTKNAQPVSENTAEQTQNFAPQQTVASNPYQTTISQPPPSNFQAPPNSFNAPPPNFQNQTTWQQPAFSQPAQQFNEPPPHEFNVMPTADFCSMHPDTPSVFLCGTCGNGFCPVCPKSYGGSVKICPFCGAMCKSVKEVREKMQAANQYVADISNGFGFDDFFNALAYPFKFKSSLIFGAVMFMFFSLGQSAGSMGNIFMAGGAMICWMLSNMLTFGVLMHTVEDFAQGKIGGNFMPSFEDFSLWDDVVHPFFLFLGTYIVSFGLLFLFIFGVIYFSWTTFNGKPGVSMDDRTRVAQYEKEKKEGRFYDPTNNSPISDDEKELQRLQKLIQEQRQKEVESVAGKTLEQEEADQAEMYNNFKNLGFVAIAGAVILLLWGIFYYPAACLVAGYTRSFVATLNPSIGIETIKLLGWDYLKILAMVLIISVAVGIISLFLGFVFKAFHLPGLGNLPAKAIASWFIFYFSVVYSLILGFVLYKNADKLNLFKG